MKRTLFIKTTDSQRIEVCIYTGLIQVNCIEKIHQPQSRDILPVIEEILQKEHLLVHDIDAVRVDVGPGSFTGVRLGIAVANILAALCTVPINDLLIGQSAVPVYRESKFDSDTD